MKVALTGTESTGKTTLSKLISETYNIEHIDECARDTMKELNITKLRDTNPEILYKFQLKILNKKLLLEAECKDFIADRTTIDVLAYYLKWVNYYKEENINKMYINLCLSNMSIYDKIYLLPWNAIPTVDDDVRCTKDSYRYEIHCLIRGLMDDNNIKYEVLNEKNLIKRASIVGANFD